MIRRPPRSTQSRSSAASDVYKRQSRERTQVLFDDEAKGNRSGFAIGGLTGFKEGESGLSLIHISEPTRPY